MVSSLIVGRRQPCWRTCAARLGGENLKAPPPPQPSRQSCRRNDIAAAARGNRGECQSEDSVNRWRNLAVTANRRNRPGGRNGRCHTHPAPLGAPNNRRGKRGAAGGHCTR